MIRNNILLYVISRLKKLKIRSINQFILETKSMAKDMVLESTES